jgi:hypothetical protein
MSRTQQTTTESTEREAATDTEWVAVSKCRGTKTPLHRIHESVDTDELELNEIVEVACDEGFDDSVDHKAKPAAVYPKNYRRLCPKCFSEEANDGE